MHKFQEIQEQAFQDATAIIEKLGTVNTVEELKQAGDEVVKLQEMITFLQLCDRYALRTGAEDLELSDYQEVSTESSIPEAEPEEDRYIAEEEVIFNNNFNQIEDADIHHPEINDDVLEEEAIFNNELNEIEDTMTLQGNVDDLLPDEVRENQQLQELQETEKESKTESEADPTLSAGIIEEEVEDPLMEVQQEIEKESKTEPNLNLAVPEIVLPQEEDNHPESRGKIVDFEHQQKMDELNEAAALLQEQHEEKKFKLSNIKGLKRIQSLFDDDPLDEIMNEEHAAPPASGSLRKTNIPTDFMEAEKPKNEFKLDLNDKIAFSKMLFGGSQSKLNETITALNGFRTLEEAREYLSEAYYEHKWEKSDEYAQRLWSLVENKFL